MTNETPNRLLDAVANTEISRRSALKRSGIGAAALALAGPAALSMLAKTAEAQATVTGMVGPLLRLKYLTRQFYTDTRDNLVSNPFASWETNLMTQMIAHETAHITALQAIYGAGYPTPPVTPAYTYGGGAYGTNAAVYSNRVTFYTIASYMEDMSIRALKSLVTPLFGNAASLNTVMRIHAVDARHATQARCYRVGGIFGGANPATTSTMPRVFVIANDYSGLAATAPTVATDYLRWLVYGPIEGTTANLNASTGEDNRKQYIDRIASTADVFDEPLANATNITAFLTAFGA